MGGAWEGARRGGCKQYWNMLRMQQPCCRLPWVLLAAGVAAATVAGVLPVGVTHASVCVL
jgi:tagatose-1,6-bisphosphate aldolase